MRAFLLEIQLPSQLPQQEGATANTAKVTLLAAYRGINDDALFLRLCQASRGVGAGPFGANQSAGQPRWPRVPASTPR